MRPEQFHAGSPGKLVRITGPGVTHAFVPDALPPKWEWPERMWPLLLKAHKALASLDGTGKHLPHANLILRPLQQREAVRSSSLEGTYSDPRQQALFELEPELGLTIDPDLSAQREIFNYGQALLLRQKNRSELPLSLRLIRDLHHRLMTGVRGGDKNPGKFRQYQNQIGKPARFVPPPPDKVPDLLDRFERYLHAKHGFDPLVEAFLTHYQFEAIHPFMDGNGRVGRLLLSILIEEWCQMSGPWLYMSAYFDANKERYMDLLFRVSSNGDWESWIEFCLVGVEAQALDTQRRCERLVDLHREFQARLQRVGKSASVRLSAIVTELFHAPATKVTTVADRHNVSYPTARSDLLKLAKAGILREAKGAEQITYFAPAILDIIHEP